MELIVDLCVDTRVGLIAVVIAIAGADVVVGGGVSSAGLQAAPSPALPALSLFKLIATALFLFSLVTLGTNSSSAQAVFGTIVGTAADATGAIIPNATIVVTDVGKGTSQTVQSNDSGNYTVSRLIPDVYTIKATVAVLRPLRSTTSPSPPIPRSR